MYVVTPLQFVNLMKEKNLYDRMGDTQPVIVNQRDMIYVKVQYRLWLLENVITSA